MHDMKTKHPVDAKMKQPMEISLEKIKAVPVP